MSIFDFKDLFNGFGAEFSKRFRDAFDKPMTKMVSEMKQNYKVLVQNLSGKKADYKDLVKIYNDYIAGDEKELENSPHQKEFAEMKKYLEDKKKLEEIKSYIEANVKDPEDAKKLIQMAGMKEQSEKIAKSTGGDLDELEKMFSNTMTSILNGTKDFNSAMKSLVTDLENYFIKSVTNAVAKGCNLKTAV